MQICEFSDTSLLPFPICEVTSELQLAVCNPLFNELSHSSTDTSLAALLSDESVDRISASILTLESDQTNKLSAIKLRDKQCWYDIHIQKPAGKNTFSVVWIDVTSERKAYELIDAFTKSLSLMLDDDFHIKICAFLCERLGYEFAFIGERVSAQEVQMLACVADGQMIEPFRYPLAGAPCEHVVGRETCVFPSNIQNLFPEDQILRDINVDSYAGAPFFDSFHKPTGLIAVMGRSPIIDAEFTTRMIEMFSERISAELEKKSAYQQLHYQATHDALCDIPNRRYFHEQLEASLEDARKTQCNHILLYLDLDQFKIVNDTCGHIAGDELLVQISILLNQLTDKNMHLARIGGDEFGIILNNCNLAEGLTQAKSFLTAIHQFQFVWDDLLFKPAASIGITEITQNSTTTSDLLKQADTACYIAKENGRNRYEVYHKDGEPSGHENALQLIAEINSNLKNNAFTLFAQAISKVNTPKDEPIKHYEILLRKLDSNGIPQSPHLVLSAAERYDLATLIDEWVIEHCFRTLAKNPLFVGSIDMLTLNLSGQSLGSESIADLIKTLLLRYALPPEKFCFEITETTAIAKLKDAVEFIEDLKEVGCFFALDDFGSGLSSMNYLKHLPVDFIKIDGTFVREICLNNIDYAMVKSINEMSHVLNMQTIAEFVENDDIKHKLETLDIDFLQGYNIEKPQPLGDIIRRHQPRVRNAS